MSPIIRFCVIFAFTMSFLAVDGDVVNEAENLSHCLLQGEDVGLVCPGSGNLGNNSPPRSVSAPDGTSEGNSSSVYDISHSEPLDSQVPVFQSVFSLNCPIKEAVYSQQAPELLVSRWNDLTTWSKRNDTSSVCEQDVERAIIGYITNEPWALQMFDSWTKPGPSLFEGRSVFSGNYYQCRDTRAPKSDRRNGFKGNYCVVSLKNLTNTFISNFFEMKGFSHVLLGACLPDTCSQDDITRLFDEKIQKLNISSFLKAASTDCRNDEREYTTFTKLAIMIVLVIATLSILGTILDLVILHFPQQTQPANGDKAKPTDSDKERSIDKEFWTKFLLSFSIYTNGQRLLSTSQPPGSINVIPGIRFLTMSWIVIGHTYYILLTIETSNVVQGMYSVVRMRSFDIISNMNLGVDSFFTISGFLVSYLSIRQVIAKGWKFDWKNFFLHRYWRLTPTLVVCLVLVQGLQRFAAYGTMAPTLQPQDKEACEQYWWRLPLYVNNLLGVEENQVCFAHAWSLAADFQFYLLSPLMLLPFYFHKYAGVTSCLFFVVAQWILAGIISYTLNNGIGFMGVTMESFRYTYVPFYARIAPFALGILCGYVMSVNGGRIRMTKSTVLGGWLVTIAATVTLIFGFHGDMSGESQSSLLVATIYNAVARSVWGAIVCWIIIACTSGYGGPINAFLSWPAFTVLGRLTYIGYLIQMPVTTVIFQNLEQPMLISGYSVVIYGTADVFFTCLVSAVLVVCVEFPTFNLEKLLRGKEKQH